MKKTVTALVSMFLFFAVSMGAVGYSGGYLFQNRADISQNLTTTLTTSGSTSTTTSTPSFDNPAKPPIISGEPWKFVLNTKDALTYTLLEGLITDRKNVSLNARLELYNKLAGVVDKNAFADGDTVSVSGIYDSTKHEIKLLASSLYTEYTAGSETVTKYSKVYSSYDASYVTHSTEITRARCKIVPYMGYLVMSFVDENDGSTRLSLLSSRGETLVENMGDIYPHYSRDYSNRPVFTDGADKYYVYENGAFTSIKRDTLRAQLYYDYPEEKLAEYNGKAEVKYFPSSDRYRFVNPNTGKNYIGTKFVYAFNFSLNGRAVIMNTSNEVKVINTSAKSTLGSSAWKYFPGTTSYVEYVYKMPDTLGIESLGFTGFDNGWLRIRVQAQSRMNNSYGMIAEDVDRLINIDGEYFDVPEGYTIEGYSNGVLMLSKNGLYGYYSINGYWIAHPMYTYAQPFVQGLAVVGFEDGTVGMIDREGNIVMPFVYTHISNVSSGIVSAYTEGVGWNVYALTELK